MAFNGFYCVSPGFREFYWVLVGFILFLFIVGLNGFNVFLLILFIGILLVSDELLLVTSRL